MSRCPLWKLLLIILLASILYLVLMTSKMFRDTDDNGENGNQAHVNLAKIPQRMQTFTRPTSNVLPEEVTVAILILSNVDNVQTRSAIRRTFVRQKGAPVKMKAVFVAGHVTEEKKNGSDSDDVIFGKFKDNVRFSDTYKILFGLQSILHDYRNVKFVAVVKDNMYVNYELLGDQVLDIMKDYNHSENILIGNVKENMKPNRRASSRWYLSPAEFSEKTFPPFCPLDYGFVLSGTAAKYLITWVQRKHRQYLPLADVYIGCAARDGLWSVIKDERIVPRPDNSINMCGYGNQTITSGFDSNEMWHLAQGRWDVFKKHFSLTCQDPDLSLVFTKNISNKEYFDKALNILVNPKETCFEGNGKQLPNLTIMLIHSHPNHFSRRKGIRNTWAKQQQYGDQNVRTLFIFGKTAKAGINSEVEVEARHHKDVIVADFVDSFKNLTLKLVLGLKWVSHNCQHAKFMYKGDDDMFVNVENILNSLRKEELSKIGGDEDRLYMGTVNTGEVIRDQTSKYYVSELDYSGKFYSPFCNGGSYVISTALVPAFYAQSLTTPLIPIDDAYQGLLAKRAGVTPVHHHGFKVWGGKFDTCRLQNDVLTAHGYTNEYELMDVWTLFRAPCVK